MSEGELEAFDWEPLFEERDPGYSESDLIHKRIKRRASIRHREFATRQATTKKRAVLPTTMAVCFDTLNPNLESSFIMTLTSSYFAVSRFLGRLQLQTPRKAALLRKYRFGVWYRLLSLGVRLISSLSTFESNHVWLLEQGALQALRKMLQLLPADRMRRAQQEAALFVYRILENPM